MRERHRERREREDAPKTLAMPPEEKGCDDETGACSVWAKGGECEKNPSYMKSSCRRSCGLCT